MLLLAVKALAVNALAVNSAFPILHTIKKVYSTLYVGYTLSVRF